MSFFQEVAQSIGARSQIIMANEFAWGNQPSNSAANGGMGTSVNWRGVRVIPGESLDMNLATYRSKQIRSDRMHNPTVRGSQKPAGSLPAEISPNGWNQFFYHLLGGTVTVTGAGPYTHSLKGSTTLPTGFTLEKGFLDQGQYFGFLGCRVNRFDMTLATDSIVDAGFDIICRQALAPSATSMNATVAGGQASPQTPSLPTEDPYVTANAAVYEGNSLTLLGTARSLRLTIDNQLFGENGFCIGSNLRQNLKPGTRMTTFSGQFMFNSVSLYNEAINGTSTKLRILMSSGAWSHQFDIPLAQFLPNGTTPKISTDGPLDIDMAGEGNADPGTGTDVSLTIITAEADITV